MQNTKHEIRDEYAELSARMLEQVQKLQSQYDDLKDKLEKEKKEHQSKEKESIKTKKLLSTLCFLLGVVILFFIGRIILPVISVWFLPVLVAIVATITLLRFGYDIYTFIKVRIFKKHKSL